MSRAYDLVDEFHVTFGLPVRRSPDLWAFRAYGQLRRDLIVEETNEFRAAVRNDDFVEAADALADLLYVVYGAALTFGLDLDAILEEVHRSNMTKLWSQSDMEVAVLDPDHPAAQATGDSVRGYVVTREDGKVLKPPTFEAPDLSSLEAVDG